MRIAFCVYGVSRETLTRTEFYHRDFTILESLGHSVEFVSSPLKLRRGFDLAFVWWWNYMWAWGPVATALRIPIVVAGVFDVTEFPTMPWWKRTLKRFGTRFGDVNAVVSEFELERMARQGAFKKGSLHYSPLAVDTSVYKPGPERSVSPFVIANVAWQRVSNIRRKMVMETLEAFARLAGETSDLQLVLAGPPEDGRPLLEARARELGVIDRVSFPGELTLEQKIELMQRCSLYCQVSRFEGFGLATAEAMACGAPVVVSDSGAVSEVVGDCGFYVDEVSTKGIYRALATAYRQRESIGTVSRRARERIIERLSVERRRRDLSRLIDLAVAR